MFSSCDFVDISPIHHHVPKAMANSIVENMSDAELMMAMLNKKYRWILVKLLPYRSVFYKYIICARIIPVYLVIISYFYGRTIPISDVDTRYQYNFMMCCLLVMNVHACVEVEQAKTALSQVWWLSLLVQVFVVAIVPKDNHILMSFVWLPFQGTDYTVALCYTTGR